MLSQHPGVNKGNIGDTSKIHYCCDWRQILNLEHLHLIEVLMQQSCSKTADIHFNHNDALTV